MASEKSDKNSDMEEKILDPEFEDETFMHTKPEFPNVSESLWNFEDDEDHLGIFPLNKSLEDIGYSLKDKIVTVKGEPTDVLPISIPHDICVHIGNSNFYCCQLLLASHCKYFEEMMIANEATLPIDEVAIPAFDFIYQWIYNEDIQIDVDLLLVVYKAANYLGVQPIIDRLKTHLNNVELFNEELAFKLYLGSTELGLDAIKAMMLTRISKYFMVAAASPEFLQIPVEDLCTLLGLDNIGVCNELEIFYTAVRWLIFDWDTRKEDILKVMKCVRFGLMSSVILVELQARPEKKYGKITSNREVAKMILNGLTTHSVSMGIGKAGDLEQLLCHLNIDQPLPRRWVYDKYAKHQHRPECPKWRTVKLPNFELYLQRLQMDPNAWTGIEYTDDIKNLPCCRSATSLGRFAQSSSK